MIFKILIYFINSIFPTYPFERLDLNLCLCKCEHNLFTGERERISPDDSRQREERLRTNEREKDGDRQKCERARREREECV